VLPYINTILILTFIKAQTLVVRHCETMNYETAEKEEKEVYRKLRIKELWMKERGDATRCASVHVSSLL
jgi:hypothetical protein